MVMVIPLMWDVIVMVITIMVIPQNCEYSSKKKKTELYTFKWTFSLLKKGSNSSLKPQAGWLPLRG